MKPICIVCNKTADELEEYKFGAEENDMTPEDFLIEQEGSYNPSNGHFYCTDCYVKSNCPLGVAP
jgi:hypothetical protein